MTNYSYLQENGTGSKTEYPLPFLYLERSHVKVYLDSTELAEGTGATEFQWDGNTTIKFNTAPTGSPTPQVVTIRRVTEKSAQLVPWTDGSHLIADDLNTSDLQWLYLIQENWDWLNRIVDGLPPLPGPGGGIDLDNLGDVEIVSPQDLEVLQYDAASAKWKNSYVELDELSDVELASPASPEVLKYDTASSKWKNQILNADDLGDVDITSPTDRSWLYFDGTNWVNGKALKSTDAWSMSDTEIATTQASDDQFSTIVSTSAPVAAPVPDVEGKSYYVDDATQLLYVWTGSAWKPVKGSTAGDTTYLDVFFVSKDNGNDSNTGHSVTQALETLDRAVQLANGDIAGQPAVDNALIYVFPGQYNEPCPIGGGIKVQNLSVVGQGLRSTYVFPDVEAISSYDPENPDDASNELKTMWACNSGTYISGMSFVGMKAKGNRGDAGSVWPDSTYGLPPKQGWVAGFYDGGGTPITLKRSPYIQNCTSFADSKINCKVAVFDPDNLPGGEAGDLDSAPTGGGVLVDGSVPAANSPIKSFVVDAFTQINLDGPGLLVTNSGYCQAVSFFGTFLHVHAAAINGGQINLTNSTTDFGEYGLVADGKGAEIFSGTTTGGPYTGYTLVGTTYTPGATQITVTGLTTGWTTNQPNTTMIVQIGSEYYQIKSATPVSGNQSVVTILNPQPTNKAINLGLNPGTVADGTAVKFFLRSIISTSGHTFEYAGSGTDYGAHPNNGGLADVGKQAVQLGGSGTNSDYNGGAVWLSSTDENGRFQVGIGGDALVVDQRTGQVSLPTGAVSSEVESDPAPTLGADLDVNGFKIVGDRTAGTGLAIAADGSSDFDGNVEIGTGIDLNTDGTAEFTSDVTLSGTGAIKVPAGTTAQQPGTPTAGMFRFNSDAAKFEGYDGTAWSDVGGGIEPGDIGTGPNQIPLNQMLGQMAFTDAVGTLRPFNISKTVSTAADLPQPVFVGETTVTFNNNDNKLYFAMRKDATTVLKGEVALS